MTDLSTREASALLPTYRRHPVEFVRGEGIRLFDDQGRSYLDFLSGLSVTSLGHAHPAVTAAVARQAATLVHTSNLFYTRPQVELAARLAATLGWPDGRAFFCNSGAEANEAAIKLARRHGKTINPTKVKVVALSGGFHGRLLGALLLTGDPAKHDPFQPLGDWVTHVPHDDADALAKAVDDDTCAVFVEVVQGEGGIRPVPDSVLHAARRACDEHQALLVVDEVQTGLGRLGDWYGWQGVAGLQPDVVCLAKALANGLPIGAIVARGSAANAFKAGDHASTFGGGPVVCAAALAVLDVIESDGLVQHAAAMGEHLTAALQELVATSPAAGVRGRGLLQGLVLAEPAAADVTAAALEAGLVVNAVAPDVVRLAPPLIVTADDIDEMAKILSCTLEARTSVPLL